MGYNINEDDNHVNSFLYEYAKSNDKRLIAVSAKNSNKEVHKNFTALKKRLILSIV